jgi:hypothetical protein
VKRLDPRLGKEYANCHATDTFSIPNPYKIANTAKCCGFTRVWLSPMHCEFWPVILWLDIKKAKSKLLSNRTTPRTVREPMCDEVGCLHPREPD